jgi:hypothetical protein
MPGHLDRHMTPLGIHDGKRVVVDERHLLGQVDDHSTTGASDLPHRRRGTRHQDEKHPWSHGVRGQVLLSELVFALATLAVDDRDPVSRGRRTQPAGEPPGHPHQMRVVQLLIGVTMQPPPPHPKPARVMTQREVGIEHDAIHAVIAARQKIAITFTELVNHRGTLWGRPHLDHTRGQRCPVRGHPFRAQSRTGRRFHLAVRDSAEQPQGSAWRHCVSGAKPGRESGQTTVRSGPRAATQGSDVLNTERI